MIKVCTEAVRRGWPIGTHAVGDRAVRTLLDVYEAVVKETGPVLVLDGIGRAVAADLTATGSPLQALAETFGTAPGCSSWTTWSR